MGFRQLVVCFPRVSPTVGLQVAAHSCYKKRNRKNLVLLASRGGPLPKNTFLLGQNAKETQPGWQVEIQSASLQVPALSPKRRYLNKRVVDQLPDSWRPVHTVRLGAVVR